MTFTVKFKMLVFQDGRFDEEVETEEHIFMNALDLDDALLWFAAMQIKCTLQLKGLAMPDRKQIQEPHITNGLGPKTMLIISEVIQTSETSLWKRWLAKFVSKLSW